MDKEILQPPRGMRDLVEKEAELHEYLKRKFQEVALLHGFKPIITPTVEFFKLFEEKSGEEIKKSMYVFKDKANRTLALRPEVTASVVRAYLRHLQSSPKPLYLYYVAQCFRYEEPQRGRYREFWQGGLEIFGDKSINADIATATTASRYLEELGINHYYIVGNVALYRRIMDSFNIPQEIQDHVLHLIDKEQIDKALNELKGINDIASEIIGELLNTPLEELEEFINKYKNILEKHSNQLLLEIEKTKEFIDTLNNLGYEAVYKPTLVRGLA
ncbi:MAG: ATP phosphoribosyltransferase regulatory subunit, partial [Staphylothermus sp.]|nr:ATP phosphoribosyltransferase regulatory subunit [Staphylothermus sp.]